MSSRRSRLTSSRITVDERIDDLVSKLHSVLPGQGRIPSRGRVSNQKALQETCSYIRSLQMEMDDLSERLSELLDKSDISTAQAAIIRIDRA